MDEAVASWKTAFGLAFVSFHRNNVASVRSPSLSPAVAMVKRVSLDVRQGDVTVPARDLRGDKCSICHARCAHAVLQHWSPAKSSAVSVTSLLAAGAPSIPNIIIFTMDYRLVTVNLDGPLQAPRLFPHHSINDPCDCCQSGTSGQRKRLVVERFGIFNPFRCSLAVLDTLTLRGSGATAHEELMRVLGHRSCSKRRSCPLLLHTEDILPAVEIFTPIPALLLIGRVSLGFREGDAKNPVWDRRGDKCSLWQARCTRSALQHQSPAKSSAVSVTSSLASGAPC
ncbi:hypothetical protein HPB51_013198 [Rhipicephalus microplus]|uniref:Uncharacterized protein n=1 Tax=Rhipicephalus microplus TaxID=6941 RepID=A0A9J6DN75_RHIMP|nr:hypothetical protein HPB51_013198 [Rhipicephalus microplus]